MTTAEAEKIAKPILDGIAKMKAFLEGQSRPVHETRVSLSLSSRRSRWCFTATSI